LADREAAAHLLAWTVGILQHVFSRQLVFCAAIAAGALIVGGCATQVSCTAEARTTFNVTVVDASGKPVCDASVKVTDGAFSAILRAGSSRACVYSGVSERKGTYSIEVRSGAQNKKIDNVKVTADECHVHPRALTVVL
jgi:hypothetical protein